MIERVNDGDTVTAKINGRSEKIRLIGIDAPELGQSPWGEIAKRRLASLLASSSRKLKAEFDIERRDKYGRLLAYLWTADGKLINREMLEIGWAVLFTIPPNTKYTGAFIEAQKKAREKRAGLWGKDGLKESPSDYRRQNPRERVIRLN